MGARPTLIDSKRSYCLQLMVIQLLPLIPDLLSLKTLTVLIEVNIVLLMHCWVHEVMVVIRNSEWPFSECIDVLCVSANILGPCMLTSISKLTALLSDRQTRFHCMMSSREEGCTMMSSREEGCTIT